MHQVYFEVAALRQWLQDHPLELPEGDIWRVNIAIQRNLILASTGTIEDLYGYFPSLLKPFESNEVRHHQNVFAFQQNMEFSEDGLNKHYLTEFQTIVDNWQNLNYRVKLLFEKLLLSPLMRTTDEELDIGCSINSQTLFLELAFERLKTMFNGPFACLCCMKSFKESNAFLSHLNSKHKDSINVEERIQNRQAAESNNNLERAEATVEHQAEQLRSMAAEIARLRLMLSNNETQNNLNNTA